jgi:hypothetical protein
MLPVGIYISRSIWHENQLQKYETLINRKIFHLLTIRKNYFDIGNLNIDLHCSDIHMSSLTQLPRIV